MISVYFLIGIIIVQIFLSNLILKQGIRKNCALIIFLCKKNGITEKEINEVMKK
jgi:hypothetical protein